MIVPFPNPSGKAVGHFDTQDKTYRRMIDYSMGQMFFKFDAVAISSSILKRLNSEKFKCEKIEFIILNYKGNSKPLIAIINFMDFLRLSKEVEYKKQINSDKQRMLELKHFTIIDNKQNKLGRN